MILPAGAAESIASLTAASAAWVAMGEEIIRTKEAIDAAVEHALETWTGDAATAFSEWWYQRSAPMHALGAECIALGTLFAGQAVGVVTAADASWTAASSAAATFAPEIVPYGALPVWATGLPPVMAGMVPLFARAIATVLPPGYSQSAQAALAACQTAATFVFTTVNGSIAAAAAAVGVVGATAAGLTTALVVAPPEEGPRADPTALAMGFGMEVGATALGPVIGVAGDYAAKAGKQVYKQASAAVAPVFKPRPAINAAGDAGLKAGKAGDPTDAAKPGLGSQGGGPKAGEAVNPNDANKPGLGSQGGGSKGDAARDPNAGDKPGLGSQGGGSKGDAVRDPNAGDKPGLGSQSGGSKGDGARDPNAGSGPTVGGHRAPTDGAGQPNAPSAPAPASNLSPTTGVVTGNPAGSMPGGPAVVGGLAAGVGAAAATTAAGKKLLRQPGQKLPTAFRTGADTGGVAGGAPPAQVQVQAATLSQARAAMKDAGLGLRTEAVYKTNKEVLSNQQEQVIRQLSGTEAGKKALHQKGFWTEGEVKAYVDARKAPGDTGRWSDWEKLTPQQRHQITSYVAKDDALLAELENTPVGRRITVLRGEGARLHAIDQDKWARTMEVPDSPPPGVSKADFERSKATAGVVQRLFQTLQSGLKKGDKANPGVFTRWDDNVPVATALSRGGRIIVTIPPAAKGDPDAYFKWLFGDQMPTILTPAKDTGMHWRMAGTHHVEIGRGANGQFTFTEHLGKGAFARSVPDSWRHHGLDVPVGGLGNKHDVTGATILPDGSHGHLYVGYRPPTHNEPGVLLIGAETEGVGKTNPFGHVHTSKATSAELGPTGTPKADRIGPETNGRLVELSPNWQEELRRYEQLTPDQLAGKPVKASDLPAGPAPAPAPPPRTLGSTIEDAGRWAERWKNRILGRTNVVETPDLRTPLEAGDVGSVNPNYTTDMKRPLGGGAHADHGYFKSHDEDWAPSQNAVASSRLARALGLDDVIARNKFAHLETPDGKEVGGAISGGVDGKPLYRWVNSDTPIDMEAKTGSKNTAVWENHAREQGWTKGDDGQYYAKVGQRYEPVDLSKPATQKGMFDLQLFDAISGQTDRHGGNIYVDARSGKVTGIDDDFSFGAPPPPRGSRQPWPLAEQRGAQAQNVDFGIEGSCGLPSMIDRGTAAKVRALKAEDLPRLLVRDGDPHSLTPSQIAEAQKRLEIVKAHIDDIEAGRKPGWIVDEWNDVTYQRALAEQRPKQTGVFAGEAPSYLQRSKTQLDAALTNRTYTAKGNEVTMFVGPAPAPATTPPPTAAPPPSALPDEPPPLESVDETGAFSEAPGETRPRDLDEGTPEILERAGPGPAAEPAERTLTTADEWRKESSRLFHKRSGELQEIDRRLAEYDAIGEDGNYFAKQRKLRELQDAITHWKQSKGPNATQAMRYPMVEELRKAVGDESARLARPFEQVDGLREPFRAYLDSTRPQHWNLFGQQRALQQAEAAIAAGVPEGGPSVDELTRLIKGELDANGEALARYGHIDELRTPLEDYRKVMATNGDFLNKQRTLDRMNDAIRSWEAAGADAARTDPGAHLDELKRSIEAELAANRKAFQNLPRDKRAEFLNPEIEKVGIFDQFKLGPEDLKNPDVVTKQAQDAFAAYVQHFRQQGVKYSTHSDTTNVSIFVRARDDTEVACATNASGLADALRYMGIDDAKSAPMPGGPFLTKPADTNTFIDPEVQGNVLDADGRPTGQFFFSEHHVVVSEKHKLAFDPTSGKVLAYDNDTLGAELVDHRFKKEAAGDVYPDADPGGGWKVERAERLPGERHGAWYRLTKPPPRPLTNGELTPDQLAGPPVKAEELSPPAAGTVAGPPVSTTPPAQPATPRLISDADLRSGLGDPIGGSLNPVYHVTLNRLVGESDEAFFKPFDESNAPSQYAVGTSRLAEKLGMGNVIARNEYAFLGGRHGAVSEKVPGEPLIRFRFDKPFDMDAHLRELARWDQHSTPDVQAAKLQLKVRTDADGNVSYFEKSIAVAQNVDLSDPRIQKGLSDLQVLDAITGQRDRHLGNISVDAATGTVKGFDDDAALGAGIEVRRLEEGLYANLGLPSLIDRETAEKVLSLDPQELSKILRHPDDPLVVTGKTRMGIRPVTDRQVEEAAQRLRKVQDHIRGLKESGELVTKWDGITHHLAKTEGERPSGGPPNYLQLHERLLVRYRTSERHPSGLPVEAHDDPGPWPEPDAARPT